MIFALSTATALAAEPADAPVSMRERMEKIRVESDPVYQAEKAKRMLLFLKNKSDLFKRGNK